MASVISNDKTSPEPPKLSDGHGAFGAVISLVVSTTSFLPSVRVDFAAFVLATSRQNDLIGVQRRAVHAQPWRLCARVKAQRGVHVKMRPISRYPRQKNDKTSSAVILVLRMLHPRERHKTRTTFSNKSLYERLFRLGFHRNTPPSVPPRLVYVATFLTTHVPTPKGL